MLSLAIAILHSGTLVFTLLQLLFACSDKKPNVAVNDEKSSKSFVEETSKREERSAVSSARENSCRSKEAIRSRSPVSPAPDKDTSSKRENGNSLRQLTDSIRGYKGKVPKKPTKQSKAPATAPGAVVATPNSSEKNLTDEIYVPLGKAAKSPQRMSCLTPGHKLKKDDGSSLRKRKVKFTLMKKQLTQSPNSV